jgi:hypothetical protein
MTYAEYVVFEESSQEKHEFARGEVYAMSGGTPECASRPPTLTLLATQTPP